MRIIVLAITLLAAPLASATKVIKCVDSEGRVTFSQHGCPESASVDVMKVSNPTPSSEGTVVRMASAQSAGLQQGGIRSSGLESRSASPTRSRPRLRCR